MQVGIMSGAIHRPTLEEVLDAILDHDLRCLQFNWSTTGGGETLDDKIAAAGTRVKEETAKRGITVAGLGAPANMIDPDPAGRQHTVARLLKLIPACESLGTNVIATCSGSRNPESMWRDHPDNASPEAWADLRNTLEQVLPAAEAAGVVIAIEPEYNNIVKSPAKARRLIDEMASPALKVIMDAANIFGKDDLPRMTEILDEAFDLLGDHIAFAHGKDLDHGGDAGHLAAGTGKLDYAHYVSLLCSLPFDVPVILHGLKEEQLDESAAMLRGHAAGFEARQNQGSR